MSQAINTRRRPIRSFIQRDGRLTAGQRRALTQLLPRFGVNIQIPFDPKLLFGRDARRTLEIGFGNGETLLHLAQNNPGGDHIGIEMHRPGVGHLLLAAEELQLENVRVLRNDAVEVVRDYLPCASIDRAMILFPDPWPKKRHHKRRLIQRDFINNLVTSVKAGGHIEISTDWASYAEHILEVMENIPSLRNVAGKGSFSERPEDLPVSRFEQRGHRLGHDTWHFRYRRIQ